ncbi:MAG: cell surface protein [Candidatus Amulumruptor caecigallinarius]|nr:cell surface protein [Candidatus Amulumruptor caecigallinarius]
MTLYNHNVCVTLAFAVSVMLFSCSKDDVIGYDGDGPEIILDSDTGVYTAHPGESLTIAPEFKNVNPNDILWIVDGITVNTGPTWTVMWTDPGEYYATIEASSGSMKVSEDIRIDVMLLTPPVISLTLPDGGLCVAPGVDCILSPDIQHDDMPDFSIKWLVDNEIVCTEKSYTFNRQQPGTYHVEIVASNCDGDSYKRFDIIVGNKNSYTVMFVPTSYAANSTDRYVFNHQKVSLSPFVSGFKSPLYIWELDGDEVECHAPAFTFTPDGAGEHIVKVTVTEGSSAPTMKEVSRNATVLSNGASAEVKVICVTADEKDRLRRASAASSPYMTKVFEYLPAPGQMINDLTSVGGMTGAETTLEAANAWALKRLQNKLFVSLGAFGGYITVGFDHSITSTNSDYDFYISGNSFISPNGSSNEPGIVWVMQDTNGNGLPDDEWYELIGSENGKSGSIQNLAITYERPSAPRADVGWITSNGNTGVVKFVPFHTQDSYYPAWIQSPRITFYGTLIPSNNSQNPSTGYWTNAPYGWGYADNIGSDNLNSDTSAKAEQRTGFKISNAVRVDGSKANLMYIDFIRVQTAVIANSGGLGEISTEVLNFADYSLVK